METFTLSITERAILANQYAILAKLSPDEADYFKLQEEILKEGYEGLYYDIFQSFGDPIPAAITSEVHHILTMYRIVGPSVDLLTDQEKQGLGTDSIKFEGFDANNGSHYAIADFYIQKKHLYRELRDMYINSHSAFSINKYRKMLVIYDRIKPQLDFRASYSLTKEEIIELIEAVNS